MIGETVANVDSAAELTLTNVLKSYYQLCRSYSDRSALSKDSTLLQTLAAYVADNNPKISLYVCKILLALSESPDSAAALSADENLLKSIGAACNNTELPIKIVKNLMIVLSRINQAQATTKINGYIGNTKNVSTDNANEPKKKTFFGKASKQYVFSFDHPTETQKRQMEMNCLGVRGVVSICFQFNSAINAKCIIRCREDVDAKLIAAHLLRSGPDVVQLLVRSADGCQQTFDFYANDESIAAAMAAAAGSDGDGTRAKSAAGMPMPAYLDDYYTYDDAADPTQCVISNEQLEAQKRASTAAGSGWFSSLKFW